MDGPGLSIFQGSDSLKLNSDGHRQEEDEFLEEEKLRKAELKNLFENAFDDLIDDDDDDDESTVASSHYSASDVSGSRMGNRNTENQKQNVESSFVDSDYGAQGFLCKKSQSNVLQNNMCPGGANEEVTSHYKHCVRTIPELMLKNGTKVPEKFMESESSSVEQLKVLYDIRLREIDRLNQLLQAEREEKNIILHKLAAAESDKEGVVNTYTQGQELLVASKEKIADLENEVIALKNDVLNLEHSKDESSRELEIAQLQIKNLKLTMTAMERCDATINREKQMDDLLNTVHAKYKKELAYLQLQLDSAIAKYNQKNIDCNALEKKLDELEAKYSANLMNKCDSMARQESTLQTLLDEANKEKLELNKRLATVQGECNLLKADLEQYESISRIRLFGNSSSDEHETDSMVYLGINRQRNDNKRSTHSGSPQADVITKLKDELNRALLGQKMKRIEIKKLQEQIRSKELQIHEMKEKERSYLAEAESLKGDMSKIIDQFKKEEGKDKQENVIHKLKSDIIKLNIENEGNVQKVNEQLTEIKKLNSELQEANDKYKKLSEKYMSFHDSEIIKMQQQAQETLKQKELEWGDKIDCLLKECREVRQLYDDLMVRNEKIGMMLEDESKKLCEALVEKENMKALLAEKESDILKLQKIVEDMKQGKLHEEQVKNVTDVSTIQAKIISSLEAEIKSLHNDLSELPRKQAIELEGLKTELELAKKRLIELEKELRLEFENENTKIFLENNQLKECISKKENEIKLLKIHLNSSKKTDVAVMTECFESPVNSSRDEAPKTNPNDINDGIKQLQENYKKQMDVELKELEKSLAQRHRIEISAVEERVKNVTVAYFSEEIRKINVKYKMDVQTLIEKQQKTVEDMNRALAEKQIEVDRMKEIKEEDIKEKFVALRNEFDAEKQKALEVFTQVAKELQDLKKELGNKEKEIKNLKMKLSNLAKTKSEYKSKLSHEKDRVTEYKTVLSNVLTQCNIIMTNGATELGNAISRVEQDYLDKEKKLKENLERRKKN